LYHRLKAAGRLKNARGQDYNGAGHCIIDYLPESGLTSAYVEDFHAKAMDEWKRHKLKDLKWVKFHMRLLARAMWSNPEIITNRVKQVLGAWQRSAMPSSSVPPLPAAALTCN
jgi:hypothetical protein